MKEWWGTREKRFKRDVALSLLWLFAAFAYAWVYFGWCKFWRLPPNEIGDFFAGVSAPLAFFWFVIAYLRQSEELHKTSEEMKTQGRSIADNELHARRDTFFRYIEFIKIEQDSILARVLGACFEISVDQIWERHAMGNKDAFSNAFVREVLCDFTKMKQSFLDDNPHRQFIFDKNIDRFLRNFELMCEKAKLCDPDNSITALLENGAMGRVYKGTCFVLEREPLLTVSKPVTSREELLS